MFKSRIKHKAGQTLKQEKKAEQIRNIEGENKQRTWFKTNRGKCNAEEGGQVLIV